MRLTKIALISCLSLLLFAVSACQKDSVEPQAKTASHDKPTAVHSSQPKEAPKKVEKQTAAPESLPANEEKKDSQGPESKPSTPVSPSQPKQIDKTENAAPVKIAGTKKQTANSANASTAVVQVIGYQGQGILSAVNVPIVQGDTVLSMTRRILKAKKIPISVRGSGATAYVEGIDNQFEFDHGPTSGWIVQVNGKNISRSSDFIKINKSDKVVWKYVTETSGGNG